MRILLLILGLFLFSCQSNEPERTKKSVSDRINSQKSESSGITRGQNDGLIRSNQLQDDSLKDEKVYRAVEQLAEVKKMSKYIDSISRHKRGIAVFIQSHPSKKEPYYWVQAGDDLDSRFDPYFNFYVYKDTYEIKYMDNLEDKVLSLKEWREKEKSNPELYIGR